MKLTLRVAWVDDYLWTLTLIQFRPPNMLRSIIGKLEVTLEFERR